MIRIGTTSYILWDDILPNVRYLAPLVDDVELVLFESQGESNLPDGKVIRELGEIARDNNLTYTVHFPLDVWPGSRERKVRDASVETYLKIIRLTETLPVFSYVLHLTPEGFGKVPARDVPSWLGWMEESFSRMVSMAGLKPTMFSAETLSYPFAIIGPLVRKFGFSVTLDIGHIWLMGYDDKEAEKELLPPSRVCHLHGVRDGKDHQGLDVGDRADISGFLDALLLQSLDGKDRVLTLEVFSKDDFSSSLALLQEAYPAILRKERER